MARYDDGFGGGYRGGDVMPGGANFDRGQAAREAYTPGGFGPEWQRRARTGYDGDFRPRPGMGGGGRGADPGGVGAPWGEEAMNGPARYGLGPYHRRLEQRRRPDDELRTDVEEALFYDTWVDAEAITVEVRDGVVTLRGELPDHDEVRYATDDAWDVDGVRGVRSELRVNSARRKPLDGVNRSGSGNGGRGREGRQERASQSRGEGELGNG
ncbi:BON domain-containing protein [Longimicrobium sp.]|uniref:BON domain-containing protein n=1 Tax=Longimicrobium sp. TaxID=2029185 RepID=UPI002C1BEC70|nr:BON domain-containing protein [Longimicrobium sp.]HSU17176.1 BON domain-containing protein [Longimicrobium sp.]